MSFKSFWKSSHTAFIIKNVLIATLLAAVAVIAVLFWLAKFTRHGQEVVVPQLVGTYVEEAAILAGNEGLHVTVIDSTYSRKDPLGAIVDQNPPANSHAKDGRDIYVIVNAKAVRQVPIPELRDISYRQAEATLRTLGIEVEEVQYEPAEYRDLVLDIRQDGRSIEAGQRLKEGSKVILVVGFGQGTEQVEIPDLIGKNREEMRATLLASRLILGSVEYDVEPTDDNRDLYVVFSQSLRAGDHILEGSRVDVQMTADLQKAATSQQAASEEDFF